MRLRHPECHCSPVEYEAPALATARTELTRQPEKGRSPGTLEEVRPHRGVSLRIRFAM